MLIMKKSILLITLLTLFSPPLISFVHYNYAVKKENSPIPYKNDYSATYKDEYEFYSNLSIYKPDKILRSRVKINVYI